jgi:hypothetical protein
MALQSFQLTDLK